MQDSRLIADLQNTNFPQEKLELLQNHPIETYMQLFDVLRDTTATSAFRVVACQAVFFLSRSVDRRRAIPPLLVALRAEQVEVRQSAAIALEMMRARRAIEPFMVLAQDKMEDVRVRVSAVKALLDVRDEHITPTIATIIRNIIFDESEDIQIRAEAIEWGYYLIEEPDAAHFIRLLSEPAPDIRFWTAYALADTGIDIAPAQSALDRMAAYDHNLPEFWGWHLDREALMPLEKIYFAPYRQFYFCEAGEKDEYSWDVSLISPAPEYNRFTFFYRQFQSDWRFTVEPIPPVELNIPADWLREKLQAAWNPISFDARPGDCLTYSLSWLIQIDGFNLLGGLHRDGYAVVLTGNRRAVCTFAAWYRSIILHYTLYLYFWAGVGFKLEQDMTAADVERADREQEARFMEEWRIFQNRSTG
ncbi:MAG: HEAT repeat domain-containing protein [Anaerolineaceae bacterium]|nr:HEAT repeat domain-containing protein [Anaerolineaceae bacterium]